ncbi:MAG: nucleotidyltransferase family protein [Tetrasphaera sp.]|nr:nucleotidyltransferase family protein [Tetrasphaera sp.]
MLEREGIVDVRVFGSVARGTDHAESDLDLLVEFPRGTSLLDVVRLEREVSELLGIPVDLVSIGALEGRFGERVRREMVPVAS